MWRRARLQGVPSPRRVKNYSAESGYVYEYWYCGMRESKAGAEYIFEATAGRAEPRAITLTLGAEVLADWTGANRRDLNGPERYGIVKTALFRLFDEAENPASLVCSTRLSQTDLDRAAAFLGLL